METLTTSEEARTGAPKKIHRLQIGLNVIVQIMLAIFLAATVNSLKIQDGIANEMTLLLNNKVSAAKAARVIDTTANPLLSQPG